MALQRSAEQTTRPEVFAGMDNGREERSSNPAQLRW